MSFYTCIKSTSEYLLALALFATVAGIAVAGLAYGWEGLVAAVAASLALWVAPWPRLVRAMGRGIDGWLFRPDLPKPACYAHERAPRCIRRQVPAHLLPYDRLKIRYGEHVAALLVFASGMGVLALACGVYFYHLPSGGEDALFGAFLTLMIGGPVLFALWRPDVEWKAPDNWWVSDPAYSNIPGNTYHSSFDDD